jgi:hypothetical protein
VTDRPADPRPAASPASAPSASSADAPAIRSRRGFLKAAGAVAATAAAASVGCAPATERDEATRPGDAPTTGTTRRQPVALNRRVLDALGQVVLPSALGAAGQAAAVTAFVAWVEGYDPVAEEMHGYGYADVRYLPADPAPGWQAQLEGLDVLARKMRQQPFTALDAAGREAVVSAALAAVPGSALPNPLGASHVAVALMAHWTSTPAATDLAYGARVGAGRCRTLAEGIARPLPIVGSAT